MTIRQPLEGIRVLELGMFHAGPGGGAILGDLGAEVIKLERPGTGDKMRKIMRVGKVDLGLEGDISLWNEAANRNKKSITVDLSKEQGREVVYRLIGKSDVFLTSLRRPAVEKMMMTYPVLSKIQPKLVYAWVSGYGPYGPDRDVGAFDYQGQGRSGLMFSVGEPGMIPLVSQFGIIDQATSVMASHQIITALLMRERLGIGQEVHVSILSSALYLHYINVLMALISGYEVPRHQRSTEYALRNYYKCADDRWIIMTITADEDDWLQFCRALGTPELAEDSRFNTVEKRYANSEQFVALLDEIFYTKPRDEWLKVLAQHDLPAGPVNRLLELRDDPQIVQNDYIVDFDHPKLGRIKIPGYPVHFSQAYVGTKSSAPEIGEHTEAVLTDIGGYSMEEIARLRNDGTI